MAGSPGPARRRVGSWCARGGGGACSGGRRSAGGAEDPLGASEAPLPVFASCREATCPAAPWPHRPNARPASGRVWPTSGSAFLGHNPSVLLPGRCLSPFSSCATSCKGYPLFPQFLPFQVWPVVVRVGHDREEEGPRLRTLRMRGFVERSCR